MALKVKMSTSTLRDFKVKLQDIFSITVILFNECLFIVWQKTHQNPNPKALVIIHD